MPYGNYAKYERLDEYKDRKNQCDSSRASSSNYWSQREQKEEEEEENNDQWERARKEIRLLQAEKERLLKATLWKPTEELRSLRQEQK